MKYKRRYRMLTLGWSDGNSFLPVKHCLLSAADDKNLLCEASAHDGRSFAEKGLDAHKAVVLPDICAFCCLKEE